MGVSESRYVRILANDNLKVNEFVRRCVTPLLSCSVFVTKDPVKFLRDGGYGEKDSALYPLEWHRAAQTFLLVVSRGTAKEVATTLEMVSQICQLPILTEHPIYLCIATYTPLRLLKKRYAYVRHIRGYLLLKHILLSHGLSLDLLPRLVVDFFLFDTNLTLLFLLSRYRKRLRFRPLLFTETDIDTALFNTIKTLVEGGHC